MRHEVIETQTPEPVTLARMSRTAIEAADTPTVREWASRIATRAAPRDYAGMLRELYDEILQRWRYVPESEEWIHGTAKSLLGTVLGVKYNAEADPTRVRLADVADNEKGWGDCDDVSTLVAAAVRAIGMRPQWRVGRMSDGRAHVSVIARTPDGQTISVDPVGHPKHEFGWEAPADHVTVFELDHHGRDAALSGDTTMEQNYFIATDANDTRGPRSLAVPQREAALFSRGLVVDGCPAVDENGQTYTYDAPRDLWLSDRLAQTQLAGIDEAYGGIRRRTARRAARRGERAAKRARTRGRRAERRRKVRRVAARIAASPAAQAAVAQGLKRYGVPPKATKGVMAAAASILEENGLPGLLRMLKKDPRKAAKLIARAAKSAQAASGGGSLSGEDCTCGGYMVSDNGGQPYYGAPVCALSGVPGLTFGGVDVADTPTPGQWYKVKKGDNPSRVARRAKVSGKIINAANANQHYHRPTKEGFERNYYGDSIYSLAFLPQWSSDPQLAAQGEGGSSYGVVWIPAAAGDEPPPIVDPVEPASEPDPVPVPDPDPIPDPPVDPDPPPLPPSPDPEPKLPHEMYPDCMPGWRPAPDQEKCYLEPIYPPPPCDRDGELPQWQVNEADGTGYWDCVYQDHACGPREMPHWNGRTWECLEPPDIGLPEPPDIGLPEPPVPDPVDPIVVPAPVEPIVVPPKPMPMPIAPPPAVDVVDPIQTPAPYPPSAAPGGLVGGASMPALVLTGVAWFLTRGSALEMPVLVGGALLAMRGMKGGDGAASVPAALPGVPLDVTPRPSGIMA